MTNLDHKMVEQRPTGRPCPDEKREFAMTKMAATPESYNNIRVGIVELLQAAKRDAAQERKCSDALLTG